MVMLMIFSTLTVMADFYVSVGAADVNRIYVNGSIVSDVYTDKSMYNPGDTVKVNVSLKNSTGYDIDGGQIVLQARHLNVECGEQLAEEYSLKVGAKKDFVIEWNAPSQDYTGYLLEIDIYNADGTLIDDSAVGVDVSSSWVKFPRYGYLYDFGEDVDTEGKIEQMNRFHINGIEYYDWQYRHHEPLPSDSAKENIGVWQDWSGRMVYGDTIKDYITSAKEKNMVNMAYDMIYAGTDDFFKDNSIANTWKIKHRDSGEEFIFTMGDSPSGNGHLYFMNPLNADWQNHLFAQINRAIDVVGFDGFHGDTVGDWGEMTDYYRGPLGKASDGKDIYSVLDTYTQFLNACKENLPEDKYLSFNPVGAKGIQNVNISNSDVLYTEFWPWDSSRHGENYSTYYALVREVEDTMNDSKETSFDGKGKSLVVKAYINYTDENEGYMNDSAVLLMDAAVFAAGGARMEIGNGSHMLHHEYYPSDGIVMSEKLKADVESMHDFSVAYENILRDGQKTTDNTVIIDGCKASKNGASDTIWTYTRADDNYEILHLINLQGTDNEWRDTERSKFAPTITENVRVRYYNSKEVNAVYIASPDYLNGRSRALDFEKGNDGKGYVEFVVPSLEYWDMIYMSDTAEGNLTPEDNESDVLNGEFHLEAEDARLYKNGGTPAIRKDTKASGCAYIHDIGLNQGYAEFTVPDNVAFGEYTLRFTYSSGTNGTVSVRINGQEYRGDYAITDSGWSFVSKTFEISDVVLKAGDKVQVSDAYSTCYIWLDYVNGKLERVLEQSQESTQPDVSVSTGTNASNPTEPTEFSTGGEVEPTEPTEPSTGSKDNPIDPTETSTGNQDKFTYPTDPVVTGFLGDANEDGKVNIKDATLIQKAIANLTELTEIGKSFADADLNTKINIKDATAIQKHIAGIETGYPIGKPKIK